MLPAHHTLNLLVHQRIQNLKFITAEDHKEKFPSQPFKGLWNPSCYHRKKINIYVSFFGFFYLSPLNDTWGEMEQAIKWWKIHICRILWKVCLYWQSDRNLNKLVVLALTASQQFSSFIEKKSKIKSINSKRYIPVCININKSHTKKQMSWACIS